MIVDNLASLPIVQGPDIRVRKKSEAEDQRPIEETEHGNNLELNFDKNNSQQVESAQQPKKTDDAVEVKVYNAQGKIPDDDNVEPKNDPYREPGVDLIV
jgi:hypothetical protein